MTQAVRIKRNLLQPKNWSQGSYHDRYKFIEPYIRGRTVLDLGCVSGYRRLDWMHGLVRRDAAHVIGVDIDEEAVQKLKKSNFEIVIGDVQNLRLDCKFQIVLAGELIEHLDNFHSFLQTVKAHLAEDGIFILTTPNVFCFTYFIYRLWGEARLNEEHTCWFCEGTIRQLLERNGFSVMEIKYIPHETPGFVRRVLSNLVRTLLPDRLAWNTLMIIARCAE